MEIIGFYILEIPHLRRPDVVGYHIGGSTPMKKNQYNKWNLIHTFLLKPLVELI